MPTTPIKLYVGCSLTHAPEEFKAAVETMKADLKADYEVFDFLGTVKGTAVDVYQWDIHNCVAQCDLFIGICDYPSIGLGYELATAVEKLGKPVLALPHTDTHVTRMILGIDAPNYEFKRYANLTDIPGLVRAKISERNAKDTQ